MLDKKEMVKQMIAAFPGGKSALAGAMGIDVGSFNNSLYEKNGTKFFDFDELEAMQDLTKTAYVADYFAQRAGFVISKIPKTEVLDNVELYNLSLSADVKRGETDRLMYESIANDGVIDKREAKSIRDGLYVEFAARDAEVRATIRVNSRDE
ncbi:YmfL family putative regulatory protein [Pragia fontium]|uniref:YmfL family putative regulatory protein n=1 Tax=Pragia fontium TaxID=82985 RepID=UPI000F712C90|nr:YmfL family putative regulatory protein [Pragia fontium]VEJ54595.1 Uncharacterised protein [Pragia fontium]